MRLHYREYGGGPPLIILHGLFGSLDNWAWVSGQLAEQFHMFALDQRNHGQSPHNDEMNYDLMAADVREFMDHHAIARAHLLGHSMGGKTAMQFAFRHGERVDRLIVADMAPRAYAAAHEQIFAALSALDLAALQTRQQAEDALEQHIPDLAVRRFLLKNLVRAAAGFRWKFNLPVLRRCYPQLNAALPESEPFDRPTLFVRGERSDYIGAADEAEIRRRFPAATIASIPNAGHWPHAEAPEIFLRTTFHFLSREASMEDRGAARS